MTTPLEDMLLLGRITGVSGVRGWVKVHSDTDPRTNILNYSPWYLEHQGRWEAFEVQDGRPQGKTLVARLAGVEDRETAMQLVGRPVAIRREQLPAAGENEYYWHQLVGLAVFTPEGVPLGTVTALQETGANDVLVVQGERNGKPCERLVPWIPEQVIREVDLEDGRITADWDPEF